MQKGISIIGAVFTLLILSIFGAAIVSLMINEHRSRGMQIEKEQAFYETQAGFEYAIREINQGGYPVVTNLAFGRGTFSTTIDYPNHLIFVTGRSGDISKTHQITYTPMMGDCLTINTAAVAVNGPSRTDMQGLTIQKTCLTAISLDKLQLTWTPNNNEKITKVTIGGTVVYNSITGIGSGGIIDLADVKLTSGSTVAIDLIQFSGSMADKSLAPFAISMTDTSYKTTTFNTPH